MQPPLKLNSGWLAARAREVPLTGVDLTTARPPSSPTEPWMEAVVPGTVLTTLLKNKLIPDPFYALENETIVDIADAGRDYYTFWFFTKFNLLVNKHARAWLQFRAINYQAEVFFNGNQQLLPKGMFRRHILDVTDWLNLNGPNLLAVLVHPPDHPGRIPVEGGQGGDHEIAKDVAAQYVEGWDWMAPIRDRNTGIWDEVSVVVTGPVKVSDPHLVGSFFDGCMRAYLHSSVEITNASFQTVDCSLKLQVGINLEGDIYLIEHLKEQNVTIRGGNTILYTFPPLYFCKPQLWWPNGMGKQPLYTVDLTVEVSGYGESDSWSHPFGFRNIESYIDPSTGGRLFKVNGEPLFIRGGNWIVSDGLLRLSEKRYKSDIDFHADMNFNMIRCWGGGIAERPEFYQNCDRRGLLVWQEFWITGDNNGRGVSPPSDANWPLDHDLFLTCARDTIKLLRNYASLALWVGGNEQHPADDINIALMNELQLYPFSQLSGLLSVCQPGEAFADPSSYLDGTRIYIQGSLWDGFAKGNGDFTDGPYGIQYPEDFFKEDFYNYGFNPEVGSVGTPVAATIRATIAPEAWQPPQLVRQDDSYIKEMPNSTWKYHKYIPYSDPGKVHDQIELYGEPIDLDDFCGKAQLVNYIQYRALMEGWSSHMWTKYTGVLIWKNQNPWTGLRGQFYDHLHDQTGGFFGVRSACEPIHVQLNLHSYFIEVVNTTAASLTNVKLEATVWDLDGVCTYHQVVQDLRIPPKKTMAIFELQYPKLQDAKPMYFLLLKLFDRPDKIFISRNFYWLHLPDGNYKPLEGSFKLRKIPLRTSINGLLKGQACRLFVQIENLSIGGQIRTQTSQEKEEEIFAEQMTSHQREGGGGKSLLLSDSLALDSLQGETPFTLLRHVEVTSSSAYSGVAFWLHFSVLSENEIYRPGNDRRILPVNYSQNYFSLTPGEKMDVEISFELPEGDMPKLVLEGWNIEESHISLQFV